MGKTEILACIRSAMFQKKVTQIEMAEVLGIDRRSLCAKFKHERFTLAEICKMCEFLKLEIFIIPKGI